MRTWCGQGWASRVRWAQAVQDPCNVCYPAPPCCNHISPRDTPSLPPPLLHQAAATRAVKYDDELSFLEDASPEKRAAAEEHM